MSGAHAAAQLCAYGSLLVLARLLPPGSFGTVAAGTAILYIAILLMDAGTEGSIVVRRELSYALLRRSLLRCLGVGVALAAAIAIGAQALARAFAGDGDAAVLAVLGLGVPLYALAVVPMALLQRAMEFRDLGRAWATSNFVSAGGAVLAGVLGAGVWALVVRQLLWCAGLAVLASVLGYRYLPRRDGPSGDLSTAPIARWFLLFGVTQVLTLNLDYLIIGRLEAVRELGLYALAFMIAFAPVQHFSAQVGKVLFAAAAASELTASGARTVAATRLMALVLLPMLPVAVVLAPPVLPAALGPKWSGMVVPFQLLVVSGVGYAVVNCIGEALSGVGQMDFRAKVNTGWCLATLVSLVVLVHLDGIRGAAIAHLVVFVAYAAIYATSGARRAGTDASALWRALYPVIAAVALQAAVTAAVAVGVGRAGAGPGLAAGVATVAGLAAMVGLATRGDRGPMREAATVLRTAAKGSGS